MLLRVGQERETRAGCARATHCLERHCWLTHGQTARGCPSPGTPLPCPPQVTNQKGVLNEQFRAAGSQDPQPARIHRGAGPERRQHAEGAEALRCRREHLLGRAADDGSRAQDAFAHRHQPRVHRAIALPAQSFSKRPWIASSVASPRPSTCGDKQVVPFLKIDKGLADEANGVQLMKPMPTLDDLLKKAKSQGHLRHQGAFGHQAEQCRRHQGRCCPAVRSGEAGAVARPRADRRAGSGHQVPRQGGRREEC